MPINFFMVENCQIWWFRVILWGHVSLLLLVRITAKQVCINFSFKERETLIQTLYQNVWPAWYSRPKPPFKWDVYVQQLVIKGCWCDDNLFITNSILISSQENKAINKIIKQTYLYYAFLRTSTDTLQI